MDKTDRCFWCDQETGNPPEEGLTGKLRDERVVFCDRCKDLRDQMKEFKR